MKTHLGIMICFDRMQPTAVEELAQDHERGERPLRAVADTDDPTSAVMMANTEDSKC